MPKGTIPTPEAGKSYFLFTVKCETALETALAIAPPRTVLAIASTTPFSPTKVTRKIQSESVGNFHSVMVAMKESLCQKNTTMAVIKNSVFRSAVDSEATKYEITRVLSNFCIVRNNTPENQPHSTRGTMQVIKVRIGFSSYTMKVDIPKH